MGSYVNSVLLAGEHVVFETYVHWFVFLKGLFISIAGGLLGFYGKEIVLYLAGPEYAASYSKAFHLMALALTVTGCCMLIVAYVVQSSTELVVTNRRVIAKTGFISRRTFELVLSRVEGASISQSILGRILGFGMVLVKGTGGGVAPFSGIMRPELFQQFLMREMERATRGER
jgi:uncharacterized membrane protein YdbT with pleckstrin-like domain